VTDVLTSYSTPPHVSWCVTADGIVFLDLKRDQYIGVGLQALESLASLFPELRSGTDSSFCGRACERGDENGGKAIVDELVEQGILTASLLSAQRGSGKAALSEYVEDRLFDAFKHPTPAIRVVHVRRAISAWITAAVSLRTQPLERIVSQMKEKKRRVEAVGVHRSREEARELLGVFFQLRPLLYASRDRCLFDSLVLMRFLLSQGIVPTLYFGVRTRPFAAHSWLQLGCYTLNTAPEGARSYSPILII
jgi:hypothetical protein